MKKKKPLPPPKPEFEIVMSDDDWDEEGAEIEIDAATEKAWAKRDWRKWLQENLKFPFKAERTDGDDGDLFGWEHDPDRFLVGITVEVLGLDPEEGRWGAQAQVRHGKRIGCVPLADLSVRPKTDPNYKTVLEYSVAVANEYVDLTDYM